MECGAKLDPIENVLRDSAQFLQQGHVGVHLNQHPPRLVHLVHVPTHHFDSGTSLSSVTATCCSTTWRGSCAGFRSSPPMGTATTRFQSVYAEGLGAQAVEAGSLSESFVGDAAGPETFSFEGLLRLVASSMSVRTRRSTRPRRWASPCPGWSDCLMRDVALTRDEVVGLMAGLLAENGEGLGRRYVSELRRNYRW